MLTNAGCRLSADTPNVVHMTVKPAETAEDDEAKKALAPERQREESVRSRSCCCVVM